LRAKSTPGSGSTRDRVLNAAFTLFREHGYSNTSMLDIVTRARVSKRDLYALFDDKLSLLAACIGNRVQQMRQPLDATTIEPLSRDQLASLLLEFGKSILKTVCQPEVLTVYRLAIAESDRAPEIARTLHSRGREANLKALSDIIGKAQIRGLARSGDPSDLAVRYLAILRGDLLVQLLMRVGKPPTDGEIEARALEAAGTLLASAGPPHSEPGNT
jgi:AcrR family transcriptional regulator